MSIEINNLSLGYQDKLVVKNLSLKFPKNKVIALIGPNGCCKSTTLKAVARLLKPKQGSITHKGQDIWQKSPKEYAQELAFLPQQHLVPEGIKVHELIAYGRSPYLNLWGKLSQKDEELVNWAMTQTQTAEHSRKLPRHTSRPPSKGQPYHWPVFTPPRSALRWRSSGWFCHRPAQRTVNATIAPLG